MFVKLTQLVIKGPRMKLSELSKITHLKCKEYTAVYKWVQVHQSLLIKSNLELNYYSNAEGMND